MKKVLLLLSCCFLLSMLTVSTSSCNRGVGCPAYEDAHVKPDRKGKLPTKRGNSSLFPKNMKRKSG